LDIKSSPTLTIVVCLQVQVQLVNFMAVIVH